MRPKNFKGGRCIKSKLKKCDEVARTYDKIQTASDTIKTNNELGLYKVYNGKEITGNAFRRT